MQHESNTIIVIFLIEKCYASVMQIPINFDPRDYQREALEALDNGVKLAVWCWARRGGKDFTAFGYAVKKMVEKPMNVVLVFPTQKQGFDNFWTNIENDGMKTLDHIPASLIASKVSSPNNMKITLKNGSTFSLLGASEPDKLRGANAKLYIFSEFVDIDSAAYDVIIPIVEVNGGQIIIQSTPKIDGISGGTFKILFDNAKKNWETGDKTQYASQVTARKYLTNEALERIRQNTVARNGNDFWYRQEFLCDWGQASQTSYYGSALQIAEEQHLLGSFPYDPSYPVYTSWDLGTSDSTAITFFQYINKRPRIIDYYETHDIGYQPIVNFLSTKPYNMAWHFIPHDGSVREQSDAQARIEKLQDCGLINSSLLRRESKEDGIRMAVEGIRRTEVNQATTDELIRKLRLYKRKFNGLTGDYEGPEHKTESHAADSIRYMFTAIRQDFDEKTGAFLYAPENRQQTYRTKLVTIPGQYRG